MPAASFWKVGSQGDRKVHLWVCPQSLCLSSVPVPASGPSGHHPRRGGQEERSRVLPSSVWRQEDWRTEGAPTSKEEPSLRVPRGKWGHCYLSRRPFKRSLWLSHPRLSLAHCVLSPLEPGPWCQASPHLSPHPELALRLPSSPPSQGFPPPPSQASPPRNNPVCPHPQTNAM